MPVCVSLPAYAKQCLCNGRTSVRLSDCLSRRLTSATAAGEFAAERPRAGDRPYRSIVAARRAGGVELQAEEV